MKSWIMRSWLERHDESEWPDLTIRQTEDACHVTDMKSKPSKDGIEKMCSDEFFAKHKYKYVDETIREDEDDDYSHCPKIRNSEAYESLDINSGYEAAYIDLNTVERGHKFMANESDYLCPVAMEAEQRSDPKPHSSNEGTTEGFGSKRSLTRTPHEATYSQVTKIKKRVVEYSNTAFSSDQDEASWDEDAESIPNYDTPRVAYENAVYTLDQGTGFITRPEACLDKYETMEGNSLVCMYQNILTCTHPTVPDQLVPQKDHMYANMQETVVGVTNARSLLGTDTGQLRIEAHYQQVTSPQLDHALHDIASNNNAGVSERNPIPPSWLNDHKLEVTFYV